MPVRLSDDLVELIESGVSILVGSRDAAMRPTGGRGLGARVGADRRTVTLIINAATSERMLANFADNGLIAATLSRIVDHHAIQLKGRVQVVRPASGEERELQERYLAAFAEQVSLAGLPRSVVRRVILLPAVAVEFTIDDVFLQTPGPGAGRKLEAAR